MFNRKLGVLLLVGTVRWFYKYYSDPNQEHSISNCSIPLEVNIPKILILTIYEDKNKSNEYLTSTVACTVYPIQNPPD